MMPPGQGPGAERQDQLTSASRHDIRGQQDLLELLTDFYGRTFTDDILRPVFIDVAKMDLGTHLPIICTFWQTLLFHTGQYRRNALHPHLLLHAKVELAPAHFDRWVALWCDTVDDRRAGAKADLAKLQATRIAYSMCRRITGRSSAKLEQAVRSSPIGSTARKLDPNRTTAGTPQRGSRKLTALWRSERSDH